MRRTAEVLIDARDRAVDLCASDPTGGKAKAVKTRYRACCRRCGADTSPRNGQGDAYAYCLRCRPFA